jgi:uncharacterized protein (TIGR02118 family)
VRKLFSLIPRRPDIGEPRFHAHWRDVHGPLALDIAGLERYVQHHTVAHVPGLPRAPYDGVSEAWFPGYWDLASPPPHHADASYRSRTRDDERNFMDLSGRAYLAVEEHVLVDGLLDDGSLTVVMVFRRETTPSVPPAAPVRLVRHVRNIALPVHDDGEHAWSAVEHLWWRGPVHPDDVLTALGPSTAGEDGLTALVVDAVRFR